MTAIYKYPILPGKRTEIIVPYDSEIRCLMVDEKTQTPCLWIEVPMGDVENEVRTFGVVTTGEQMSELITGVLANERDYIGSFQIHRGEFIGHVFELI